MFYKRLINILRQNLLQFNLTIINYFFDFFEGEGSFRQDVGCKFINASVSFLSRFLNMLIFMTVFFMEVKLNHLVNNINST